MFCFYLIWVLCLRLRGAVLCLCFVFVCLFFLLPGLRWIVASLLFHHLLYLYFCKIWSLFILMVFLCCWLSSAACPPSGHHGRMEDTHLFTYIFYMISSYQIFCWWHFGVVFFFPALFMRHLLHVCSVCPGGGIPSLWLSLESQVWGQRTSLTVQIVKPTGGMWLWFWAIWIKLIWFIPWSVCVELDDVWCVQMFCDTRWWWVHWHCCYFVLVCKDNRRAFH